MVPSTGLKKKSTHYFLLSSSHLHFLHHTIGPMDPSRSLSPNPIKFLCSYGGRILPRYTDGKLRYHGGETRLLSVDSSISYSELLVKMGEMCGSSVSLRCQLPTEDLDALVSITSEEDLANLIEEYHRAAAAAAVPPCLKIRAFLSAPKTMKKVSPPPTASSFGSRASTPKSHFRLYSTGGGRALPRPPASAGRPYKRLSSRPATYPIISQQVAGKFSNQLVYHPHISRGNGCGVGRLIHNSDHWQ